MGKTIIIFLQGKNSVAIKSQLKKLEYLIDSDFPNMFKVKYDSKYQDNFPVFIQSIIDGGIDLLVNKIETNIEYNFCSVYRTNN